MKYIVKKIEGDEYLCPWTVSSCLPRGVHLDIPINQYY
jgi:hypothetical protein